MRRARLIRMLERMNQISLLNEIWSSHAAAQFAFLILSLYGDCAIANSCQHLNSFYKTHSLVLLPNACYPQHSVICTDVKMQRSLQLNCSLCGQVLVLFTLMACRCFQPSVHMAKGFYVVFLFVFSTPELQKKKLHICQAAQ